MGGDRNEGDRVTAPGRIACCVPFCRRTTRAGGFEEWICGNHWRSVPRTLRARKTRLIRRYRRRHGDRAPHLYASGSPERIDAVKNDQLLRTIWDRCKAAAIEAAAGI